MPNLGIIGSGITGAITAYLLKQYLPSLNVTILEKRNCIGGRMVTSHSSNSDLCTVDLGAQYFSKTKNLTDIQQECYHKLTAAGLLKCLAGEIYGMPDFFINLKNYISPEGSGSIVKYFIENSKSSVHLEHQVVSLKASKYLNCWTVKTENSMEYEFDIIVFAIPAPEILKIDITHPDSLDSSVIQNLKEIKYASTFALGLFYENTELAAIETNIVAKYISKNPFIRFVSFDARKRGFKFKNQSLIIHATKEFSKMEKNKSEVEQILLTEVKMLFPDLPEASETKFEEWHYCQVKHPYPTQPRCITLCKKPLLICGGDSFSSSNFEGCLMSAEKVYEVIVPNL